MAVTREILNSHPISNLRKEIAKTNIRGYSKMTKAQLVDVMMKHKERFSHIKPHTKAPRAKKAPAPAPKKTVRPFKKGEKVPFKIKKKPEPKAKTPTPKAKTPTPKAPTPKAPTPKAKTPSPSVETPTNSPKQVVKNFPFEKSSGGRPLGLSQSDLFIRVKDAKNKDTRGFRFVPADQLLKKIKKDSANYREGGFYSGRLGSGFREAYDRQEEYIKDGNYKPPLGVVAKNKPTDRGVDFVILDDAIPLIEFLRNIGKPEEGDMIKIIGKKGVNKGKEGAPLIIDNVVGNSVEINYKINPNPYGEYIGDAKISNLKKIKGGWSVKVNDVTNRDTDYWTETGK